jgi:hypothetical protein
MAECARVVVVKLGIPAGLLFYLQGDPVQEVGEGIFGEAGQPWIMRPYHSRQIYRSFYSPSAYFADSVYLGLALSTVVWLVGLF